MSGVNPTPIEALTSADLTYNMASGLLTIAADGWFEAGYAGSGGRSGSTARGAFNYWLANNPFATTVKLPEGKSHPGGPIPMGKYRVVPHESRVNWLRLLPCDPTRMYGRSGMAIHGRGPRGSDGCIVPTDFTFVERLYRLASTRKKKGLPDLILQVVAIGQDLDAKLFTA